MSLRPACVLLCLLSACSTMEFAYGPTPHTEETAWTPSTRIELVSVSRRPAVAMGAAFCKADLLRARDALSGARDKLLPEQWELLDKRVTSAEREWVDFESAASANGMPAEIPRAGARGLPVAGGVAGTLESAGAAPALALLILFWPSSSIAPECERCPEPLLIEQRKTADALREVSKAAEQVKEQLQAGRQRQPQGRPEDAPVREPRVNPTKEPKPKPGRQGRPPCILVGIGGEGLGRTSNRAGQLDCRWRCGDAEKHTFPWGRPGEAEEVCKRNPPLDW